MPPLSRRRLSHSVIFCRFFRRCETCALQVLLNTEATRSDDDNYGLLHNVRDPTGKGKGKVKPYTKMIAPPDMGKAVLRLPAVEAPPLLAVGLVTWAGVIAVIVVPSTYSGSPGRAASRRLQL